MDRTEESSINTVNSKHNRYDLAIQYLNQFYNRTINRKEKHHIKLMAELLQLCSVNHEDFTFVQIAGSCGKGSTAHFISSILQENKIKHGLFTGPHLQAYEERFQIGQEQIGQEEFAEIVLEIAEKLKSFPRFQEVGHMHIMLLIALLFFKNHQIDLVIFENGVGGASDPSNLFNPAIAVLTEVTLDHCHLLGDSIEAITEDKLQIIKETTQFAVCGMKNREAKELLFIKEKNAKAKFLFFERDYKTMNEKTALEHNQFDYHGTALRLENIALPLIGEHQIQNAANALAVIEALSRLGFSFNEEKVKKGLEQASISCRMEFVQHDGVTFLFDGAHNSLELQTLKKNIQALNLTITKMILTVSSNKDIRDMLESIYIEGAEILLVPNPFIERRVSFADITSHLDTLLVTYRTFADIDSALQTIVQEESSKNGITLVTGSLYLVGRIKKIVGQGGKELD